MENTSVDSNLITFFLSLIPGDLLAAYRKLVCLKYPISDQKSFRELLKNPQVSEDEKFANGILLSVFEKSSFPLVSEQNALEKFHSLLPATLQIVPLDADFIPPLELAAVNPDLSRWIERRPLPDRVEVHPPFLRCFQRCEEFYKNCMKDVSVYDEVGKARCMVGRALCMNRCRGRVA